ncbi:hypothetical protein PVAND_011616 [Polypedilum vanderplanki]|uniref:U3 small nucleolar RNA-associated protein 18-like protein n=1 Tax=Polypedilum vanderplanki TaxID=319348 RepID=A0A9J6CJT3_POLVA|nr:hypothetical protein PVAND_011616 [Polypedilum vanderplanki]
MSDSSDTEDLSTFIRHCEETDEINGSSVIPKKKRKFNEQEQENENELNEFLFGNKNNLLKNLESQKNFFLDTGGDEDEKKTSSVIQESVWHDEDDDEFVEIKGKLVKEKQKRKLERIGNTPSWADLNKKRDVDASDSDEDVISKTIGFLDKKSSKKGFIQKGEITFKRLKNLNRVTENEGVISSVLFHPRSFVGIVAGRQGLVSLFAVDGKENKKIHNLCYEKYFIHSCKLTNDGNELIIGGQLKDFHTYDLMSGNKQRIKLPRGVNHMKCFELSPCGKYIAIVGDFGEVHLLHAVTKELLFTFKQEFQSTSMSFSNNSYELYSHSDDNEITIFDIRTQRVKHRFVDEGCVNGTVLKLSSNGKFLATGSRQGFVNIYNSENIFSSKYPQPLKVLSNLNTEISDLKFNHTSELLAFCSTDETNALKLLHVESGSVYSNFPSHLDNIGKTNLVTFSPESGFLAVGTISSKVPLYRLNHYNNY